MLWKLEAMHMNQKAYGIGRVFNATRSWKLL
uniref:Uncharacterized protein n=1 Tax=Tetranychus urticae TaxID=32264 RepID=T1JY09_TETUR